MSRPRLLDLYCCEGGAGKGYADAGFEVVGVDIDPQPRYPFEFHQGDALEFLAAHSHEFDAIHASPPCQGYLNLGAVNRKHRLFESNVLLEGFACQHGRFTERRYWTGWRPKGEHRLSTVVQIYGNAGGREHWPAALGVDWMSAKGMTECVPPAYAEHIGRQLLEQIEAVA